LGDSGKLKLGIWRYIKDRQKKRLIMLFYSGEI